LALQFTAGAAYPIAALPGLSVTLDYKYFAMPNQRSFKDVLTFTCPGGVSGGASCGGRSTPSSGAGYGTYNAEYNHSIMFGVRYAFGKPAMPAPQVAAAPTVAAAATRSYLVFFDWDKATLTDRARQIVAEAAQSSKKVQTTRIEVNGYADTSGTPVYNKDLAMRRAQAVSAELVKGGVKKEEIVVMGYGDTRLLVPTGPGVKEPQNRRVEIVLK
jgi:OmpA-OmpF porin, OOP family